MAKQSFSNYVFFKLTLLLCNFCKTMITPNYFSVEVDPPEMTCGMIPGIS